MIERLIVDCLRLRRICALNFRRRREELEQTRHQRIFCGGLMVSPFRPRAVLLRMPTSCDTTTIMCFSSDKWHRSPRCLRRDQPAPSSRTDHSRTYPDRTRPTTCSLDSCRKHGKIVRPRIRRTGVPCWQAAVCGNSRKFRSSALRIVPLGG